jgi:hypothetical protein
MKILFYVLAAVFQDLELIFGVIEHLPYFLDFAEAIAPFADIVFDCCDPLAEGIDGEFVIVLDGLQEFYLFIELFDWLAFSLF